MYVHYFRQAQSYTLEAWREGQKFRNGNDTRSALHYPLGVNEC